MLNSHTLNNAVVNGLGIVPVAAPVVVYSDTQGRPYRVELHDKDGVLLLNLPGVYGGKWERQLNKPGVLRIGHAGDTSEAQSGFAFPNELWLFEGDSTTVTARFRILNVVFEQGDGTWLEVTAYDLAEQLGRELVTAYATPVDAGTGAELGDTIQNVLTALFAQQSFLPKINLGTISGAIRNAVWIGSFDGRSILQCLSDLQEFAGGYWWVDTSRRLQWRTTAGNNEGHRIRLGHNAAAIRATFDYSELATRVVARGEGVTADTVLTVTKNDSAAQAEYGIITARLTDQGVRDVAVLGAIAQAELDRRKEPKVYFDVDALDLSKTSVFDYAFEARLLTPGSVVNLLSDIVDVYARVERVEVDLDNPLGVVIEVGQATGSGQGGATRATAKDREDVAVIIAELAEAIEDLQNDRGEVESVRKSLDPVPDDLDAVVTWDEVQDEGILPEKLGDVLEIDYGTDAAVDGLKEAISTTIVESITNNIEGVADAVANAVIIEEDDRATLNLSLSEGQLGRTTGTYKHVFAFIDGLERPLQILRAPNVAALDALAKESELGEAADTGRLYFYNSSFERCSLNVLE